MFGKKSESKPSGRIDTLIGAGTCIEGDIRFAGGVRIDGEVRGSVLAAEGAASSVLVLSELAQVNGSVSVDHLVSNGTINGAVVVKESLELQPKAKIIGDVEYSLIEIHQGAVIEGRLVHALTKSAEPTSESLD